MNKRSTRYFVAVDGGGSGCRVRICDAHETVMAEATGGPANVFSDAAKAIANVLDAIKFAGREAALQDTDITLAVAHLGLAGVLGPDQTNIVRAAMPFRQMSISDDRLTTLTGALGTDDGILISVGTGSFVAAKSGQSVRYFGGWGHKLSDDASGYWLGQNILRRTVLAFDGLSPHSDLTQSVLAQFGGTAAALVHFAQCAQPVAIAALAPQIVEAAKVGDPHARELMQNGADYLMSCLRVADWVRDTPICLTGGIGPVYTDYLDPDMQQMIRPPMGSALDGAMQIALAHVTTSGA